MISEWKACLAGNAAQWGMPESGDWRFLLYNNYHPHCSDMDLFWFHNGGTYPRAVIERGQGDGHGAILGQRSGYAPCSLFVLFESSGRCYT